MTDPTTLTPPAGAPLPWRAMTPGNAPAACYIVDANSDAVVFVDDDEPGVVPYLVAAANAYPGLVAERDALRADRDEERLLHARLSKEYHDATRRVCASLAGQVETLTAARDTALARVAEMEAQLAKQAPVIEAARTQAETFAAFCLVNEDENDDRPWLAVLTASRATESAIRTLDKETP